MNSLLVPANDCIDQAENVIFTKGRSEVGCQPLSGSRNRATRDTRQLSNRGRRSLFEVLYNAITKSFPYAWIIIKSSHTIEMQKCRNFTSASALAIVGQEGGSNLSAQWT